MVWVMQCIATTIRGRLFSKLMFLSWRKKRPEEQAEFELYTLVNAWLPEIIGEKRKMFKGVSANIDFFSGFVYAMLGLPRELYTPMFAVARIVGCRPIA